MLDWYRYICFISKIYFFDKKFKCKQIELSKIMEVSFSVLMDSIDGQMSDI